MTETTIERVKNLCYAYFPSCVENTPTATSVSRDLLTVIQPLTTTQARVMKISLFNLLIVDSQIVVEGSGLQSYQDPQLKMLMSFQRSLTFTNIGHSIVLACPPYIADPVLEFLSKTI